MPARSVIELAAPAAAVTAGTALGLMTDQLLYFTLLPAIGGALLSTYLRTVRGKQRARDVAFATISALIVGVIFGPWVAQMAPKSEHALAPMCFVMAMLGTRSAEKLADFEWDMTAWLGSIIRALAPPKDDEKK